jgi:hypothetical protein
MATRKTPANGNHLEEAMALLIRNQAAFVEQISRNDQERIRLHLQTEEWQRESKERLIRLEEWQRKSEEWQRKSDERFARIETQLREMPAKLVQAVLDQMPRIKKEIGFKSPT